MANDKTLYHESQVLDRIFDNQVPDGARDGGYIALWATTPTNDPNETNEINGNKYNPVHVSASDWTLVNTGGPRRYETVNAVEFGVLDDSQQITIEGTVVYDGQDTATDNPLYFDDDFGTETVDPGDEFKLAAGDAAAQED